MTRGTILIDPRAASPAAWLRALLLLLVFAGLNAQAFACPAAMAGMANASASAAPAVATVSPPSCHDMTSADAATSHNDTAPATSDTSAKHALPACCGVACTPAVTPLAARVEPAVRLAPARPDAAPVAALADVSPSTEKPPPRSIA